MFALRGCGAAELFDRRGQGVDVLAMVITKSRCHLQGRCGQQAAFRADSVSGHRFIFRGNGSVEDAQIVLHRLVAT